MINLNPRSVYNKQNEFHTLVSELSIDLICISESWERENLTLDQLIQLEDYKVISNVHQRVGKGGRPAIIVNERKYFVQNITNNLVNVPYGVEIVWAILTPKNLSATSRIKKIVIASVYSKPSSKKKTLLQDHIAETYHLLRSKYQSGLHFIMAGDTNDLKLDPILSLSPQLKQVVSTPTRKGAILDPIITTLATYYQTPVCLPPLDPDPDQTGAPSDHMIVFMEPINGVNNNPARVKKTVTFRPLPESGIRLMGAWLVNHSWDTLYRADTAHRKAEIFQNTLLEKLNLFLPEKTVQYTSQDQVWITPEIKQLARKKSREFSKHRRSPKWKTLNSLYEQKCQKARSLCYTNIVSDLKNSNPGQWYSKLKRMCNYDQLKTEKTCVEEISQYSDLEQAEIIAEKFSNVSNQYEAIDSDQITRHTIGAKGNPKSMPTFEAYQVYEYLRKIKTNTSTVKGDIPAKLIKEFAPELSDPLSNILNCMVSRGEFPYIWKLEMVTPAAKVHPPASVSDLRKISGLKNFSKIAEKRLGKFIIEDMSNKRDPSQFGNQKGVSVNHYLIKMIHEILSSVDNNTASEKFAVFCSMIDWKQAFDRQCPTLGVQAFVENGVRNDLVPLLTSYFQDRRMIVKWHGVESSLKILKGGGPQGGLWGILEYLAQSNNNTNSVKPDRKFKFIDDLSILEVINLLSIGIASYNFKSHVPSNIPANGYVIPKENLKTQAHLNLINEWTKANKMLLNEKKCNGMIFNFCKDYQFTCNIKIEKEDMEIIPQTKLLGVMINDRLTWDDNTKYLVQRANSRLRLLHKLVSFSVPIDDLINIYVLYVRSILEQSCQVWHSSLTLENANDLERIQKNALKIILQDEYENYSNALSLSGLKSLIERRKELCLRFAKACLKNQQTNSMFPLNPISNSYDIHTRHREKFLVTKCNTTRLKNSAIPYMQSLLNTEK